MDYKIFWTEEAIQNIEEIIYYLTIKWTQREVENFKSKPSKKIGQIALNMNILTSNF